MSRMGAREAEERLRATVRRQIEEARAARARAEFAWAVALAIAVGVALLIGLLAGPGGVK